jgi:hypothetical protein
VPMNLRCRFTAGVRMGSAKERTNEHP